MILHIIIAQWGEHLDCQGEDTFLVPGFSGAL